MTADAQHLGGQLESRWQALPDPPGESATVVELPTGTAFGKVMLGRTARGRSVYVPFAPDLHVGFEDDRRSRAIHLNRRGFEIDGSHKWYAELLCLDDQLNGVFTTLVTDLVVRLEGEHTDPVSVTIAVLRAWRSLFAGAGRLLGVRQLGGLFGELLVLERLLARDADAATTWRGPFGERHDFVLGWGAIEVKTVLADAGSAFRVHGVEQLLAPDHGELVLTVVKARPSMQSGASVPDIVDRLSPIAGAALAKGLAAIGYREGDADVYRRQRFELLAQDWYEVDATFPRLTPDSFTEHRLPVGVSDLEYTVDPARVGAQPMSDVAVGFRLGETV